MKKQIDFPPYTEAQIKEIHQDGSIVCDLFGEGYTDTNIGFATGNPYLSLTDKEIEEFRKELKQSE